MAYDHREIEKKWQDRWQKDATYRTVDDPQKEKKYVLDMFPYPSGEGLHVGHPKGYIATDIYSRHARMQGFSVLHPMGWDAFGLPAENYALKHKTHPRVAVEKNIANFKEQLAGIGFDYDWSREINTTDPSYYHWTQWIFLKMLEHGLAFQSNEPINWCPSCMTGLANEDLDGAVCERCDTPVVKKNLPQWVLRITDYADRMLTDLDTLNWPEHIKEAQRNWIGRSEGAEITFEVRTSDVLTSGGTSDVQPVIKVFTTRPDTIYGATYLVLAPEHPFVRTLLEEGRTSLKNRAAVEAYAASATLKTEIDRSAEGKEKTGVKLEGVSAINPATKEEIPVYIADYVLASYGTGAIMAVPAHDERDFAFAKKFNLPIKKVVARETGQKRENEEFRDGGAAVVFDPISQKYAIALHENGKPLLFAGGVNEGENVFDGVVREVQEESGLHDFKHVEWIETSYAHYFNTAKKVNRVARAECLLIVLNSTDTHPVALEEHEKFTLGWMSAEEIKIWWLTHNEEDGFTHYVRFLDESVARAIELGFDTTSDPKKFISTLFTGYGTLENSDGFNGLTSEDAKKKIVEAIGGKQVTRYKLRDWVFSRQRYWGEPIPVIHCEKDGVVPVPYEELPVLLPEIESYEPTGTGESPLAAIEDWVNVPCPKCKGPAKRETNTMPQWAGSSWYYLRFMDPENKEQLVSTKKEKYWAPVDVYVGGDHAVRHLIYARFWHKFLYDISVVSTPEPFARLEFLGFILAEDGRKMSKRFGNVINPTDVVAEYGADAFRIYEMFMAPFENTTAWSTASIKGTARFVDRLWQMQEHVIESPVTALDVLIHEAVRKIGNDIEAFKFNTAVSQMMILLNAIEKEGSIGKEQWGIILRTLAPFAPHITEELWEKAGETGSIHLASWPTYDESLFMVSENEITVQVNGKRRGSVSLAIDASEADAVSAARALPGVGTALGGKEPVRVVYVLGKVINLVV